MKSPQLFDFQTVFKERNIRRVWEVDEAAYAVMKDLKDDNGYRLWIPPPGKYPEGLGTFMGLDICIAKESSIHISLYYNDSVLVSIPVDEVRAVFVEAGDAAIDTEDADIDAAAVAEWAKKNKGSRESKDKKPKKSKTNPTKDEGPDDF